MWSGENTSSYVSLNCFVCIAQLFRMHRSIVSYVSLNCFELLGSEDLLRRLLLDSDGPHQPRSSGTDQVLAARDFDTMRLHLYWKERQ